MLSLILRNEVKPEIPSMGSNCSKFEPRKTSVIYLAEDSIRRAKCAAAAAAANNSRKTVELKTDTTSEVSRRGIQNDRMVGKPNQKPEALPSTKESRKELPSKNQTNNFRRRQGISQRMCNASMGKGRGLTLPDDFSDSLLLPDSTHCNNGSPADFNVENKENVIQQLKGSFVTQARPLSDEHHYRQQHCFQETTLQPCKITDEIQTVSDGNQHGIPRSVSAHHTTTQQKAEKTSTASVQRFQKKLRPASSSPFGKARQNSMKENYLKSNEDDKSNEGKAESIASTNNPVEHPNPMSRALPWMHARNEQLVAIPPPTESLQGNNPYGGHSNFRPVFPPMNGWCGYHQEQRTRHHWAMPSFLVPVAATMRHPFANFMPNYGHTVGQNDYQPNHACDPRFGPFYSVVPAENGQMPVETEEIDISLSLGPVAKSSEFEEAEAVKKLDSAMEEEASAMSAVEVVDAKLLDLARVQCEGTDLPSTFAPIEYVEKIRARHEASNGGKSTKDNQGCGASSMPKSSSKSTEDSNLQTAQQASSPRHPVRRLKNKGNSLKIEQTITTKTTCTDSSVQVMNVLGKRVTMIDPNRKVFIIDLLSPETCDEIRSLTDKHVREVHESGSSDETWRTLYTYTKMDLPVVEVADMTSRYTDRILHDVKRIVGEIYGMKKEAMKLRPRSWKEPHLLLYQAVEGKPHHTGIEMHYDGCDITWQAMLTRLDEYEGGGTYFRCLRQTVKLRQGQVLVNPGELYHKGLDITYGVRCLLVCFTDGMNPKIMDDSKQEDDSPEYEDNVVYY